MQTKSHLYVLILLSTSIVALAANSAEPELKLIMQGLRDDAVKVSDGLLTDDFTGVASGAMRIANHAQIPPEQIQRVAAELGTEMATFKQFDILVHELSLSIATAAEEKDSAKAIADYQRMLSNCFGCHAAYKSRVSAALSSASRPQ